MRIGLRFVALLGAVAILLLVADLLPAAPKSPDINIVFEAEQARGLAKTTMFKVEDLTKDASGKISGNKVLSTMETAVTDQVPIRPTPREEVSYTVRIPKVGTYFLWARVYWSSGAGNSMYMKVEGFDSDKWLIGGDGSYEFMHWICLTADDKTSNPRPLPLKKGTVTFTLGSRAWHMRIDQFLLTTDPKRRPADIYKPTKDALVPPKESDKGK